MNAHTAVARTVVLMRREIDAVVYECEDMSFVVTLYEESVANVRGSAPQFFFRTALRVGDGLLHCQEGPFASEESACFIVRERCLANGVAPEWLDSHPMPGLSPRTAPKPAGVTRGYLDAPAPVRAIGAKR